MKPPVSLARRRGWNIWAGALTDPSPPGEPRWNNIRSQDLSIRFDVALALLAKGEIEAAQTEYRQGMTIASEAVADARSRNEQHFHRVSGGP